MADKRVAGHIKIGAEWLPVNVLWETHHGWAEWRNNPPNGGCESGVIQPGRWTFDRAGDETLERSIG